MHNHFPGGKVELVLEKLAGKLAIKYPQKIQDSKEVINPAFAELTEYVKTHFSEKFTLEQLGKKFGLSAGYICNLFARHYNTTLTCFVTEARMQHAAVLLNTSNLSLKQIAIECGYKDYFYFNKVFKGHYGMSPSQYEIDCE